MGACQSGDRSKQSGYTEQRRGGDRSSLARSKLYDANGQKINNLTNYDSYAQVTKVPTTTIKKTRQHDYATQNSSLKGSKLIGDKENVSLKLDDQKGVSRQAEVYYFDYEKALHHYISWVDKDGNRSMHQSKLGTK